MRSVRLVVIFGLVITSIAGFGWGMRTGQCAFVFADDLSSDPFETWGVDLSDRDSSKNSGDYFFMSDVTENFPTEPLLFRNSLASQGITCDRNQNQPQSFCINRRNLLSERSGSKQGSICRKTNQAARSSCAFSRSARAWFRSSRAT